MVSLPTLELLLLTILGDLQDTASEKGRVVATILDRCGNIFGWANELFARGDLSTASSLSNEFGLVLTWE
jgi:hypothetical protein